jgi:hypothetical protein
MNNEYRWMNYEFRRNFHFIIHTPAFVIRYSIITVWHILTNILNPCPLVRGDNLIHNWHIQKSKYKNGKSE